jgi:hypothetical protein
MLLSVRCQSLAPLAASVVDGLEYEVPLEPFQIHLQYDDSDRMAKSDEMMVLNSTQKYLTARLHEREPGFSHLFLYQFVRDYVLDFQGHYSKIAMNGIAHFDTSMSATRQREVQAVIMVSLTGDKVEQYIGVLHSAGMTHVVNATLLSMNGNPMVNRDGPIVESSSDGKDQQVQHGKNENTRDMDDDMRRMTLLLCLLVPGIAMLFAAVVYACRSVNEINWKHAAVEPQYTWRIREIRISDSQLHKASKVGHHDAETCHIERSSSKFHLPKSARTQLRPEGS